MAEVTPTRDPCREGESLAIEPAGLLSSCRRSPNTPAFATKSHHEETEARTHRSERFSRRCGRRGQPRTAEAEPGAERTRSTRTIPTAAGMIRAARAGRCPSRRSSARLSASTGRISNRHGRSSGLAPISASRSVPTSSGSAGFARAALGFLFGSPLDFKDDARRS